MEKKDLLKRIDKPFLDRLFGFCYARTRDSYEAEQLCSDVTFAMVKAAGSEGEVENPDAFLWKIARNVYAEFSRKRKQETLLIFEENADKLLADLADEPCGPRDEELLAAIYRQIAFLTKIYRETMILFYLDGRPASEIAKIQGVSETAVRQRLFSARNKIRNEVTKMTRNEYAATTPTALKKVNYCIWGTGNPSWGDPRDVLNRQFSNHILSLCCKEPRSAEEIAQILNVPTLYVEEELEILTAGANGEYGFLRKEKGGKYGLNIILLDGETMKKGAAVYTEQIPALCDLLTDFIMVHEKEYLAFPYINRRVTLNLVLWQQFSRFANLLSDSVIAILQKSYFADEKRPDRPFSVFGYAFDGKDYGGIGHDGIEAYHLEGYHHVSVQNLYGCGLKPHFHCGENISTNPELQLAIRAVNGLSADSLSEQEKEHATKAVKSGYLYREGDTLYTKILVNDEKDSGRLFAITGRLCDDGRLQAIAEKIAEKTAALIRETVPAHLLPEWRFFNILAGLPVADSLLGAFTERGILQLPKDGLDAEGCWMSLETEKSRKNILREYSGYKKTDRFIPDSRYDLNGKLPEILAKYGFESYFAGIPADSDAIAFAALDFVCDHFGHDGCNGMGQSATIEGQIEFCETHNGKVNCRGLAILLASILRAKGIKARHITCMPYEEPFDDCHVVVDCLLPSGKRIMLDPTYHLYYTDTNGEYVTLRRLREMLINGEALLHNPKASYNKGRFYAEEYRNYMTKNTFRFARGYTFSDGIDEHLIELIPQKYVDEQVKGRAFTTDDTDFWKM